jgi:hypothetical protein
LPLGPPYISAACTSDPRVIGEDSSTKSSVNDKDVHLHLERLARKAKVVCHALALLLNWESVGQRTFSLLSARPVQTAIVTTVQGGVGAAGPTASPSYLDSLGGRPRSRGEAGPEASFAIWFLAMTVHVLAHLWRALRLTGADLFERHSKARAVPYPRLRRGTVLASFAMGVTVAIASRGLAAGWSTWSHHVH